MQFNVSSLLQEPTGAVREYTIDDDLAIDGEGRHLSGQVRFDRTTAGILVRACLRGTVDAACSRCLAPVAQDVLVEFEEEYLPTIDVHTAAPILPGEGQEDAYRIDVRHILDLTLPAAQYWALALPMAPLCSEDCRGLCPDCGANRNAGPHGCSGTPVDARWEKLATLKLG